MKTDTEKIMEAADFMEKSQGYADLDLVSKMSNIPFPIVANVLENNGYEQSEISTQYTRT